MGFELEKAEKGEGDSLRLGQAIKPLSDRLSLVKQRLFYYRLLSIVTTQLSGGRATTINLKTETERNFKLYATWRLVFKFVR